MPGAVQTSARPPEDQLLPHSLHQPGCPVLRYVPAEPAPAVHSEFWFCRPAAIFT